MIFNRKGHKANLRPDKSGLWLEDPRKVRKVVLY